MANFDNTKNILTLWKKGDNNGELFLTGELQIKGEVIPVKVNINMNPEGNRPCIKMEQNDWKKEDRPTQPAKAETPLSDIPF